MSTPGLSQSVAEKISFYETGATTVIALAADPRFSYCLYVPNAPSERPRALLAVIHGSYRHFNLHRDQFQDFAEYHNCIIVAPLFPGNLLGDNNLDGFKYLFEGDICYDQVLEQIMEQGAQRYQITDNHFGLVGFSGGAHFAHRFLILRPQRLWGAAIGAPGSVTLLDPGRQWWVGVADTQARFGRQLDLAAIRNVPVQLIVGDEDLETQEITHSPQKRYWVEGANEAGVNRIERLRALERSFIQAGVTVTFNLLPGEGHEAEPVFNASKPFLSACLSAHRAS